MWAYRYDLERNAFSVVGVTPLLQDVQEPIVNRKSLFLGYIMNSEGYI